MFYFILHSSWEVFFSQQQYNVWRQPIVTSPKTKIVSPLEKKKNLANW